MAGCTETLGCRVAGCTEELGVQRSWVFRDAGDTHSTGLELHGGPVAMASVASVAPPPQVTDLNGSALFKLKMALPFQS